MSSQSASDRQLSLTGNGSFLLIVAIAFLIEILNPPEGVSSMALAAMIALGVLYILIGTYGLSLAEDRRQLWALLVYFAIEIVLALAIMLLGRSVGQMWLLVLPVISQSVIMLPRRWMLAVAAAGLLVMLIPILLMEDVGALIQAGLAFLAAVIFVVLFTQIAVNERTARAEGERLAGELRAANDKLRAYAVQAEDLATMQERNRLARDIHDGIGHYLTVVNVQLQVAQMAGSDTPRARAALENAQTLTRQALADVRNSVAALRAAPTANRPLPDAIAALIEENRSAGIITAITVNGEPRPLSAQADLTLYRAVQEALTNVRKHARASRTDIALDYSRSDAVTLSIQDNGVGATDAGSGFGLLGLRERVHLLGGTVDIQTAPRQGFTLTVEIPA